MHNLLTCWFIQKQQTGICYQFHTHGNTFSLSSRYSSPYSGSPYLGILAIGNILFLNQLVNSPRLLVVRIIVWQSQAGREIENLFGSLGS